MHSAQGNQVAIIKVSDWEQARKIGKIMRRWLFRGQAKAEWSLKSSLERVFESRGIPVSHNYPIEELMLIEFKSAAQLFATNVPKDEDTIAWLSLIRHYGGPTRLLDFTESYYVASYFALDNATEDCAIWAFNRPAHMAVVSNVIEYLCKQYEINLSLPVAQRFDQILLKAIQGNILDDIVLTMASSQRNERQFLQQGLAIIPLNLEKGYMGALLGSFGLPGQLPDEKAMQQISFEKLQLVIENSKLIKIIINKECFLEARMDLEQMNINGVTLFRGLDGLGRKIQDVMNVIEHHLRDRISESSNK